MTQTDRPHWTIATSMITVLALGGLGALCSSATAQQAPPLPALLDAQAPGLRRDQHQLIRMHIVSQAQMDLVLALGAEPMNCEIGPGRQEFCVSPTVAAQLQAMGLRFTVLHQNIQALIDADLARMWAQARVGGEAGEGGIAGAGGGGEDGAWFIDYKTYPQIDAYMNTLVALRPDLASRVNAGTTIQGRPIHVLHITSSVGGPNKPALFINGCQHAREWIAVMTPMYVADRLIRDYGSDPRITALLDRVEFYIAPVANPDGYEYTYAPAPNGDRMWRKNRRNNGGGAFGVDLNRNWSVDWGGPNSTSTSPSSELYIGTAAFSEPETSSLRDFIVAHPQIVAHIDFHNYGQLILQPYSHTDAEHSEFDLIDYFGTSMNQAIAPVHNTFYSNGWSGALLYLSSGTMRDWTFGERDIAGYTIELRDEGDEGFLLSPDEIVPTGQEILPAILEFAERTSAGAVFVFPRGVPATLVQNVTTPLRVDIRDTPGATLAPATATLHWRIGSSGAFTNAALSVVSGEQYLATLPALGCEQHVEFYVEIETTDGDLVRWPIDAPTTVLSANAARQALAYNFEAVAGWTVQNAGANTAGQWQRGVPVNDINWPYDPRHDADGAGTGACTVTGNTLGASDLDTGSTRLISPVINLPSLLQAGETPAISYAWFLHQVSPVGGDVVRLEISTNGTGGPWTNVATHNTSSMVWRRHTLSAADLSAAGVTLNANTALRFIATDGNPQSVVEAGIDDVRIWGVCPTIDCPADVNGDGDVDIDDLLAVIVGWGACPAPPAACLPDIEPPGGNGQVDVDDMLAVITGWGACQ